jgi:hypothetical protein
MEEVANYLILVRPTGLEPVTPRSVVVFDEEETLG